MTDLVSEKQLLENLCYKCNLSFENGCADRNNNYCENYKKLKKDLEILETLRSHLINAGIGMFDNVGDNEIFHLKLTFSGKEYKQMERWLENDNNNK